MPEISPDIKKIIFASLIAFLALSVVFFVFSAAQKPETVQVTDNEPDENGEIIASTTPETSDAESVWILQGLLNKISQIISMNRTNNNATNTAPVSLGKVMAWIYPGNPSCGALGEMADGRRIDVLKPEYFRIDDGGVMTFLDEENHGCNGYSEQNVELVKSHSKEQYVTVASASAEAMNAFLVRDIATNEYTEILVNFVIANGFDGVELDFEDFGGWNAAAYSNYKSFVTKLGRALHQNGKKLMIDGPAVSTQIEENWFAWRYADFVNLPVDYIVVMAYDYQFDHGVGEPVAPIDWIKRVIDWTSSRFPDKSRLVIGLPSYGYYGALNANRQTIITYEEARALPGFGTATRDERSGEMAWIANGIFYSYQDSESIERKVSAVLEKGVNSVSIWHLGGNNWFNN